MEIASPNPLLIDMDANAIAEKGCDVGAIRTDGEVLTSWNAFS